MPDKKKVSAPIRMSPELLAKVQIASERTGISQADILRLCLSIGLEDLRRIDYDLPGSILSAARQQQAPHLKVAEEPTKTESPGKHSHSTLAPGAKGIKYPSGRRRNGKG
jgi:predicted DNA-binding protein